MFIKISIALMTSLLVLTFNWYFGLMSARSGVAVRPDALISTKPCQSDIGTRDIQKLSFDTPEGTQAALTLIALAKESCECRDVVIQEVVEVLNKADLENDDSALHLLGEGFSNSLRLKSG